MVEGTTKLHQKKYHASLWDTKRRNAWDRQSYLYFQVTLIRSLKVMVHIDVCLDSGLILYMWKVHLVVKTWRTFFLLLLTYIEHTGPVHHWYLSAYPYYNCDWPVYNLRDSWYNTMPSTVSAPLTQQLSECAGALQRIGVAIYRYNKDYFSRAAPYTLHLNDLQVFCNYKIHIKSLLWLALFTATVWWTLHAESPISILPTDPQITTGTDEEKTSRWECMPFSNINKVTALHNYPLCT
jgi:hypothetical protein